MLPVVEDLPNTYPDKFKLLTIDFDQNRLLAKEQSISSVPYVLICKDGEKIWEKNGETNKEKLIKILHLE
jgi:thioredoxin 1